MGRAISRLRKNNRLGAGSRQPFLSPKTSGLLIKTLRMLIRRQAGQLSQQGFGVNYVICSRHTTICLPTVFNHRVKTHGV